MSELSRLERLVSDLGELTRLESPEMTIERKKIDADAFLQGLRDRFLPLLEKEQITADWAGETKAFTGDETLLVRAMSNIISNAVRHTPENGRITVAVRPADEGYELSVHNSGETIPPEEIGKVFDRLYRGEYARNTPGSGLGLTIARKIARLHGGDALISSDVREGTTVLIQTKKALP